MVETFKDRLIRFLEDHRGFILVVFGLPLSFLFDLFLQLRNVINRRLFSAPKRHDDRVRSIQQRVAAWNKLPATDRKLMCTARPNFLSLSTTFFRKDLCHKIPVPLYDILELNTDEMTVRVEPMVTVGDITRYLVPKGYTLAVTLEIADATVGGLAMGTGMTTYSHNVGLYQETVVAYEMVMADGSLVRATADNDHADLFACLPWSHGTLGFCVALELKIIPVKPFVRLEYRPVKGQKSYCDEMRRLSGALDKSQVLPAYLEATVFNHDDAVITVGNFDDCETAEKKAAINHIARWYKPWWYKHVESYLEKWTKNGDCFVEYVPLEEYLLRHNRSIFWVLEAMIPFGNHPIFRLFLGWMCPVKPAFMKFTTTSAVRNMTFCKQVFQDIVLPMNVLEKQIDLAEKLFDIFPLLIYPCRIYKHSSRGGQLRAPRPDQMCPGTDYAMFNDLGVYGVPGPVRRRQPYDPVHSMRAMEAFIRECGGYSFLYADIFMTESEFNEMFDTSLYKKIRERYHCKGAFPTLFDKVRPEVDVFSIGKRFAEKSA